MTCEVFERRKFQAATPALVDRANAIIAEYRRQSFVLTLMARRGELEVERFSRECGRIVVAAK